MSVRIAKFLPNISLEALRVHLAQKPTSIPLHIGQNATSHWRARHTWKFSDDLAAIRSIGEDKEVEIEVGKKHRGYMDPEYQRVHMGLGLFLDAFILNKIPSADPDSIPTACLAQSDLLEHGDLAAAVPELDLFKAGPQGTMYRRTIWIGPRQSFTPFHRDPYIGLYTQVLGTKTFHVLPPDAAQYLDPSTDPQYANTSTLPLPVSALFGAAPSAEDVHPKLIERSESNLEKAFGMPGSCQVLLKEGESVLVPEGWWHSAEGGDQPGIGVGAWFR